MPTKFLDNVRAIINRETPDSSIMGGWTNKNPTGNPWRKCDEHSLHVTLSPNLLVSRDHEFDAEILVGSIRHEVYGQPRAAIRQYIADRELDGEALDELNEILGMMQ